MTTNKHLSRGIAIVDGKKVFAYGYYCKIGNCHCLIKEDARRVVFTEGYGIPYDDWVEVISEPDLFYKTINGIDFFEGDFAEIIVKNHGGFEKTIEVVIDKNGKSIENLGYHYYKIIGKSKNTHGIADGIKEGE